MIDPAITSYPDQTPGVVLYRGNGVRGQVAAHTHDLVEIEILEAGQNRYCYSGQVYRQPARSVLMIPAGERHEGGSAPGHACYFRKLHLAPTLLAQLTRESTGHADPNCDLLGAVSCGPITDDLVVDAMIELHALWAGGTDSRLRRDSQLVYAFACLLERHGGATRKRLLADPTGVRMIRAYLEEHYRDNVSLDELATLANRSKFHLLRAFHRTVGMPPHAYQLHVRLARARARLERGEPAVRVAAELGFADQSHFIRHFKRAFGMTPGRLAADAARSGRASTAGAQ